VRCIADLYHPYIPDTKMTRTTTCHSRFTRRMTLAAPLVSFLQAASVIAEAEKRKVTSRAVLRWYFPHGVSSIINGEF
jgi:hypothetical protein